VLGNFIAPAGWCGGGRLGRVTMALSDRMNLACSRCYSKTANGTPLYAPYPLSVAIPAMVIRTCWCIGCRRPVTALVVAYNEQSERIL